MGHAILNFLIYVISYFHIKLNEIDILCIVSEQFEQI